jgi:outer membrane translocation and assembly module TamA
VGGPALIPGYRHEELKGAQALAGAVSLRYPVFGQLQLVARGGAGNVFANTQAIGFRDLRWGAGIGVYYPGPIGPVSLELGVRDDGQRVVSLVVGWN